MLPIYFTLNLNIVQPYTQNLAPEPNVYMICVLNRAPELSIHLNFLYCMVSHLPCFPISYLLYHLTKRNCSNAKER